MKHNIKESEIFLKSIKIQNYLSLRDVYLPLKNLTILVGPNASGKSNTLRSLQLLNQMMKAPSPPNSKHISNTIWAGQATQIGFELNTTVNGIDTKYQLKLQAIDNNEVALEELQVGSNLVISVKDGKGEVKDEKDATQITVYNPATPKIALKSAGDYGDKPITRSLSEFISDWEFYNFEPSKMRGSSVVIELFNNTIRGSGNRGRNKLPPIANIDDDGSMLGVVLNFWAENRPDLFESVNESLKQCTNLQIEQQNEDENRELYLQEGYDTPIPLEKASDGTLRLIAYYILLNQPELPSLIAIEEPERNLHPKALVDIASVLEQLSLRTQVIITTHSSQLLDAFSSDQLANQLSILLLWNTPGQGTRVINLEDVKNDRESLEGWITDFGIGSAIFESELLQDLVGS